MQSNIIKSCKDILKSKEVQNQIIEFMRPFVNCILNEIYPYLYLSILLVFICFLLLLAIFLILLKRQKTS